ncbi:class I SAM-dependent methyltransferase [Actinokineospora sp. 24-640]
MTFSPEWLALREPADADARATALLDPLRAALRNRIPLVARDMGCGTGSMARWLSERLPRPQHWVLHDVDPLLLEQAGRSVRGPGITTDLREGDLARVTAADLAGTALLTASALLDVLTAEEVDTVADACSEAGCAALLSLSVTGEVELSPTDALDSEFRQAFNDHQRRPVDGRRLLGPDAVRHAVTAFEARGARVLTAPSPWRLGADQAALIRQWLHGWVGAACEQRPDLANRASDYLRGRLSGDLHVVVRHVDILALPACR